jgi:hypothetical protein
MTTRAFRRLALAALLAAAAGCGPYHYVNDVTRTASADVAAAREAQADQYAPYWFTLAVEYLSKAREEAAQADFQTANRLGRKASEAARKALDLSVAEVRRAPAPRRGP